MLIAQLLFQTVASVVVFGVLLFGGGGTFAWPQAWVFLVIMGVSSLVVGLWIGRRDPDLLRERMSGLSRKDQVGWDRVFMPLVLIAFAAWVGLQGLDHRFNGLATAPWLQGLGAAMILASMAGSAWTFATNSYAAPVVKLQKDRGQTAITTGPYALVRHPLYASAILFIFGMPLLLGSLWGLPTGALIIVAIAWRAVGEEGLLAKDLAGYSAYMAEVRWRLIPGIW